MSAYKEAIDILTGENIDFRAIVIQIAKDHPSIFIKSTKKLLNNSKDIKVPEDVKSPEDFFNYKNGENFIRRLSILKSSYDKLIRAYGREEWLPGVLECCFSAYNERPQKIKAIKNLRLFTKCGLKEAKYFIEDIIDCKTPPLLNLL